MTYGLDKFRESVGGAAVVVPCHDDCLAEIMDSSRPKSYLEHAAEREIRSLQGQNKMLTMAGKAQRKVIQSLRRELDKARAGVQYHGGGYDDVRRDFEETQAGKPGLDDEM